MLGFSRGTASEPPMPSRLYDQHNIFVTPRVQGIDFCRAAVSRSGLQNLKFVKEVILILVKVLNGVTIIAAKRRGIIGKTAIFLLDFSKETLVFCTLRHVSWGRRGPWSRKSTIFHLAKPAQGARV